jgi:hypothetical protein
MKAKMTNSKNLAQVSARRLTTEDLAQALALQPQSIRKRFSQTGQYFGVRPDKMPNGRLMWPTDAVEQLISGGV